MATHAGGEVIDLRAGAADDDVPAQRPAERATVHEPRVAEGARPEREAATIGLIEDHRPSAAGQRSPNPSHRMQLARLRTSPSVIVGPVCACGWLLGARRV
jgi:hypothetical protein